MAENQIAEISSLISGEPEIEKEDDLEAEEESETGEPTEEEGSTEIEDDDQDVSWEKVLGVGTEKLVLDENGEFKGVRIKVDGKTNTVDLNTLISGYQTARSTTQRSQALAAEKKEFDQQRQQLTEHFKQKLGQVEQLTQVLGNKFMSDYEGINWQRLRIESPAEYAATIQDFQLRQQGLQQLFASIQNDQALTVQQQKALESEHYNKHMQEQADLILEKFPTWSNPQVASEAFTKMQGFLSDYGYTSEEFSELADARAIAIVQDAMKYRAGRKMSEQKLAKPVPKFQSTTSIRKPGSSKLDRLVSRAKRTGKKDDQVAAVSALLSR